MTSGAAPGPSGPKLNAITTRIPTVHYVRYTVIEFEYIVDWGINRAVSRNSLLMDTYDYSNETDIDRKMWLSAAEETCISIAGSVLTKRKFAAVVSREGSTIYIYIYTMKNER